MKSRLLQAGLALATLLCAMPCLAESGGISDPESARRDLFHIVSQSCSMAKAYLRDSCVKACVKYESARSEYPEQGRMNELAAGMALLISQPGYLEEAEQLKVLRNFLEKVRIPNARLVACNKRKDWPAAFRHIVELVEPAQYDLACLKKAFEEVVAKGRIPLPEDRSARDERSESAASFKELPESPASNALSPARAGSAR